MYDSKEFDLYLLGCAWVFSSSSLPWTVALRRVGLRSSMPRWLAEGFGSRRRSALFRAQCAETLCVQRLRFVLWDFDLSSTLSLVFWDLCLECSFADIPIYSLAELGARLWKEESVMELAAAAELYEGRVDVLVTQGEGRWARRLLDSHLVLRRRCPVEGALPPCALAPVRVLSEVVKDSVAATSGRRPRCRTLASPH